MPRGILSSWRERFNNCTLIVAAWFLAVRFGLLLHVKEYGVKRRENKRDDANKKKIKMF